MMKHYFAILLFVFFGFLNAKDLNIELIQKEIFKYNREGKQEVSQKKLANLLLSDDLTLEEKSQLLLFTAYTYRSVNDYLMSIYYLNKSNDIAQQLPKDDPVRMKIDFEYAFAYFDNGEYDKANEAMKHISAQHYHNVIPVDQSYILLQEGFLFLRAQKYDEADLKYIEALKIMKKANPCNLPVVYTRMIELYGKQKKIEKAVQIYKQSMKMADSCGILKYKVFATQEMEKVYKQNNMLNKAYGLNLDSLIKLESLDSKLSELHVIDREYLEKGQIKDTKIFFWGKLGSSIVAVILLSIIGFSFFRSRNLKLEKIKMEDEIEQMKEDLNYYAQNIHFNEKLVKPKQINIDSDKLTDRQKDLLKLMADGLSNKEIAEQLFISENTVKYHIKNIYSILGLKDRKDFFKKISNN